MTGRPFPPETACRLLTPPSLYGRDFHYLLVIFPVGKFNILFISVTPLYKWVYSAIIKIIAWKICLLNSLPFSLSESSEF